MYIGQTLLLSDLPHFRYTHKALNAEPHQTFLAIQELPTFIVMSVLSKKHFIQYEHFR
jgi:hypothetical protein